MCPAARDFFARQGDLMRKYFVYFKSNQRHMAEKDLSFGHVGNFQTSPSLYILDHFVEFQWLLHYFARNGEI